MNDNCQNENELIVTYPFITGIKTETPDDVQTLKDNYLCIAKILRKRNLDYCLSKNNTTAVALGMLIVFLLVALGVLIFIYNKNRH
jgi:hypothetical protein